MKTPEKGVKSVNASGEYQCECQWRRSGVFIINFEHISHLVLVFLFLTLSWQMLWDLSISQENTIDGVC